LKYAQRANIYYDTARTLIPKDERTKKAQKYLIREAKKTKKLFTMEEVLKIDFPS
jgi:hypothetical protein